MKTHAQTSKSKSSITKPIISKPATSQFKTKPDLHISTLAGIANGSSGAIAQKAGLEEEELMQGKFKTAQLVSGPEEEELMQGKFETVQKQELEDEELLQGKFETAQLFGGPEEEELQGKFKTIQKQPEEDELLQGKFKTAQLVSGPDEEELMQGKFETIQKQEVAAPKNNNTGLPDHLKAGIENLSGYSMDDVKVHYNSSKPADLHAHAFAQGTDIHLNSGQEKHLPHEAWHVVQQKQGRVKPTLQMKGGVNVNDDKGLESEADAMGGKALNGIAHKVRLDKNSNSINPDGSMLASTLLDNKITQLAPNPETGRLSIDEAASIDTLLSNNGIAPELFTETDWATLQQSYRNLVATNQSLIKANSSHKKRRLRAKIATDYNALILSARQFQNASNQNIWSLEGDPTLNGGRLEINIRQQGYREESPTYTIHVSVIRHLFENYWILANDGVTQTEDLNTMAYCSADDFSAAFIRYGQAIITAMNLRHHSMHREVFNTIDLDYDSGGELKFNSDRPRYNVHAFPVETEGSAVTLDREEHQNLKLVLRAMSAAKDSRQRREGKISWGVISSSANVKAILLATNGFHDTKRLMEE